MNWSCAVTVMLNAVPAATFAGADTKKCVAAPEPTVMLLEVPVIVLVTVSVALMVWLPDVFKVTENVPVPLVRVEFAGKIACVSELVKCTVPV